MNTDPVIQTADRFDYHIWGVHRGLPINRAEVEELLAQLKELSPLKWEGRNAHYLKCPICKSP